MKTNYNKLLRTIHNNLIHDFLSFEYQEFNKKDKQLKADIKFLIALRKYLKLNKGKETFKKVFKQIKENLEII